jgi:hypothetical protein
VKKQSARSIVNLIPFTHETVLKPQFFAPHQNLVSHKFSGAMALRIRSGMSLAFPFILQALMLGAQGTAVKDAPWRPEVDKQEIQAKERQVDEATGCEDYKADFDVYAVCKKRGLPTRRSTHGGFAYRPMDQDLAGAALPPECRDAAGQPKWNGAPEVIEWTYCDNLNSGCEYYLFVQRFTSLDDLRLKDTLSASDKVRAFVQACRQETFGGAHELAYVGTYPLMAQEFLDVLFGTQTTFRPKDAFGFDGMRRQGLALAAPPPFRLESFLFDKSLALVVGKLNAVIHEFETFRNPVMAKANELASLEHAKTLTPVDRQRRSELTQERDVLFVKTFNELHAKGVFREHKMSNGSAADALKQALAVYPAEDPQRERFEDLERRLREAVKEFDTAVDAAVQIMSRPHPAHELVYHPGDSLFLFLKGTGPTAPKLRMTLRIRRMARLAETLAPIEQPFGVLTRAFDDPPEINRQQNIVFATDYQRYWVSLFTQPLLVVDTSYAPDVAKGVVENCILLGEVPGDYIATIELFDETTKRNTKTDIEFGVVPNQTAGPRQGLD